MQALILAGALAIAWYAAAPAWVLLACGLAAIGWIAFTAAQLSLLADARSGRGDAMLVTGEAIRASTLIACGRFGIVENAAYLIMVPPLLAALWPHAGSSWFGLGLIALFAVAVIEVWLLRMRIGQRRGQRVWRAVRERQPDVALAGLREVDLAEPARVGDSMLAAEAWVMRGDIPAAIAVLAAHAHRPGPASRDAWLRLGRGELGPAKALLVTSRPDGALDQASFDVLFATLAVAEGRGAEVVARADAIQAVWHALVGDYADTSRLAFAAACVQAGHLPLARAALRGIARPLAEHAYLGHANPAWWALIETAAGARIAPPPVAPRVAPAAADVFAPPAVDPIGRAAAPVVGTLEGAQPVPGLRIGNRRRTWRALARVIVGPVVILPLLMSVPLAVPVLLLSPFDLALVRLFAALAVAAVGLAASTSASVGIEWLVRRDAGKQPVVVYESGNRVGVADFRWVGWLTNVERFGVIGLFAFVPFGVIDASAPIAWIGPVFAVAMLSTTRPYARAHRLIAAAAAGDSTAVLRIGGVWLRAWLTAPATRDLIGVYGALAHARRGDADAARAALPRTSAVAEVRWCRAWLDAGQIELSVLERLLADDAFGWWRLGATGARLLTDGRADEIVRRAAEWAALAQLIDGPHGDVLRAQLAAAYRSVGDTERAALIEGELALGVESVRWIGAIWPAVRAR